MSAKKVVRVGFGVLGLLCGQWADSSHVNVRRPINDIGKAQVSAKACTWTWRVIQHDETQEVDDHNIRMLSLGLRLEMMPFISNRQEAMAAQGMPKETVEEATYPYSIEARCQIPRLVSSLMSTPILEVTSSI